MRQLAQAVRGCCEGVDGVEVGLDAARVISRDLVPVLMEDDELPVRQILPIQLKEISILCLRPSLSNDEMEKSKEFVVSEIIPHLGAMFISADVDVRRSASEVSIRF